MTDAQSPAPVGPPTPRSIWYTAEAVEIFPETSRVKTVRLRVPGWPGHRPGQHVVVRLTAPDGYHAQRSYSLASAPEPEPLARELLELTIERLEDGEVSPYLTETLRPGDRIELRGPIGGHFSWMETDGGPLILVAGGSGVVPLMSMLRRRARAKVPVPACLLYSSRSREEIIYREELERLSRAGDGFHLVHTLTRSRPPAWNGFRRRIDREMLAAVTPPSSARPLAFVCGPSDMVETVSTALVDLGHQPERVRTERFGATGG